MLKILQKPISPHDWQPEPITCFRCTTVFSYELDDLQPVGFNLTFDKAGIKCPFCDQHIAITVPYTVGSYVEAAALKLQLPAIPQAKLPVSSAAPWYDLPEPFVWIILVGCTGWLTWIKMNILFPIITK